MTLSALVAATDSNRRHGNLSSAVRLFVLSYYRDQLEMRDRREEMLHAMIGRSTN